ncbi:hypothetical protein ACLK1T_01800 [Escherichia coli]
MAGSAKQSQPVERTVRRRVTSSQDVTEYLQQLLEREREAIVERDEVGARKNASMKRSNV